MPDRREYLFIEVDRQLEEVREQALALATRAGLVLGAVAVGTSVLTARLPNIPSEKLTKVFWALGIASLAAIIALAPALAVGPNPIKLQKWRSDPDDRAIEDLLDAKVLMVGANRIRLLIMTCAFYLESVAVVVAVIMALLTAASTKG